VACIEMMVDDEMGCDEIKSMRIGFGIKRLLYIRKDHSMLIQCTTCEASAAVQVSNSGQE
jgi:hypothetical protein